MERFIRALVLLAAIDLVWHLGMWHGIAKAEASWGNGPEGYCLADKPPHPGECKSKVIGE